MVEESKLNNSAWNSLNEIHGIFSMEYKAIKFYNPEYCFFGDTFPRHEKLIP